MPGDKHTPGEWRAVHFEHHDVWDVDAHRAGHPDDDSGRFSVLEDLTEADAHLIAASPGLLDACRALLDEFATTDATEKYEREAAAFWRETGHMAPGKDEPAAAAGSISEEARRLLWVDFRRRRALAVVSRARAAIARATGGIDG